MNELIEHSHLIYPTVGTIAYLSWPKNMAIVAHVFVSFESDTQ
jgi:hypothetical protein